MLNEKVRQLKVLLVIANEESETRISSLIIKEGHIYARARFYPSKGHLTRLILPDWIKSPQTVIAYAATAVKETNSIVERAIEYLWESKGQVNLIICDTGMEENGVAVQSIIGTLQKMKEHESYRKYAPKVFALPGIYKAKDAEMIALSVGADAFMFDYWDSGRISFIIRLRRLIKEHFFD